MSHDGPACLDTSVSSVHSSLMQSTSSLNAERARARSYTSLSTPPELSLQRTEKRGADVPPTSLETSDEPYAVGAIEGGVDSLDFNHLFNKCARTQRRPADRVFLKSWKGFSLSAAEDHHEANPDDYIALCYDLSDYDECFWNYRDNCFLPAKDVEQFDHILEAVYVTKGSFATDPVTHKTTETVTLAGGDVAAATTMQGWRIDNEDAHVVAPLTAGVTLSAVLDGHGGARVAAYAAPRLAGHLRTHLAPCLDALSSGAGVDEAAVEAGVVAAFLAADADIENNMSPAHCDAAGSTVNALLLAPHHYVCGNAGDSRLIVVREGGAVEKLSHDHKPESDEERGRVVSAGGRVVDGRVEGILAVSRAVGDFDFKQAGELDAAHQAVTAKPDVIVAPRRPTDRFLIQACDGIWDVVSDEEAAQLVQAKLEEGASPAAAAEALCDHCLALELVESGIGTDNMSVNLIVLSPREQKVR